MYAAVDMNTELRINSKNYFEKEFFKLMNNAGFGKTMENVRNHRDIKLVTSEAGRKYFTSAPNYHTIKKNFDNLVAIEMKRTWILMNKPLYLVLEQLPENKLWIKTKIMVHGYRQLYSLH